MTLNEIFRAAEDLYEADPTPENWEAKEMARKVALREYLARAEARDAARAAGTTEDLTSYAAWFVRLLSENRECTDIEAFENIAYRGYVSYGLSMSDGYYAAEDFDQWVTVFRKAPISQLYGGNESRSALAPQVFSYISQINR